MSKNDMIKITVSSIVGAVGVFLISYCLKHNVQAAVLQAITLGAAAFAGACVGLRRKSR